MSNYDSLGYALAMRVLQSDLYRQLDDTERGECDELVRRGMAPSPQPVAYLVRYERLVSTCQFGDKPPLENWAAHSFATTDIAEAQGQDGSYDDVGNLLGKKWRNKTITPLYEAPVSAGAPQPEMGGLQRSAPAFVPIDFKDWLQSLDTEETNALFKRLWDLYDGSAAPTNEERR